MSKQNQHFQESLAMSQLQQDERRRKRVNELEQTDLSNIHDEDDMNKSEHELKESDKRVLDRKQKIKHPYLGSKVDLNG